jgi:hypothetical protein
MKAHHQNDKELIAEGRAIYRVKRLSTNEAES